MKPSFVLLLLLFQSFVGWSQLNCETKLKPDSSSVRTCFHVNGKVSTVETWDKNQLVGKIVGFNSRGSYLFSHDLKKTWIDTTYWEYHPNGQVRGVRYLDTASEKYPDYEVTYYYENGKEAFLGSLGQTPASDTNGVSIRPKKNPRTTTTKRVDLQVINQTNYPRMIQLYYHGGLGENILEVKAKGELYHMLFIGQSIVLEDVEVNLYKKSKYCKIVRIGQEEREDHVVITWEIVTK